MAEIRSHDFSFDLCVVTKYGVSVGGNNIVAMRPGLGIALRTRRFFDVTVGFYSPMLLPRPSVTQFLARYPHS